MPSLCWQIVHRHRQHLDHIYKSNQYKMLVSIPWPGSSSCSLRIAVIGSMVPPTEVAVVEESALISCAFALKVPQATSL